MQPEDESEKAQELRWEACMQLNNNVNEVIPTLGITVLDLVAGGTTDRMQTFSDYVTLLAQGTGGGDLEIGLLANSLDVSICIFTESKGFYERMTAHGAGEGKKVVNLLRRPGEHFDLLLVS